MMNINNDGNTTSRPDSMIGSPGIDTPSITGSHQSEGSPRHRLVYSPAHIQYDSPLLTGISNRVSTPALNGRSHDRERNGGDDEVDVMSPAHEYEYQTPPHVPKVDGNHSDDPSQPLLGGVKTRAYGKRWYVLTVFCLVTIMQGLGWGSFGPITQSCKAVFGWHDNNIAIMALAANMVYIICCFPFSWLMERHGMRISLLVSTFMIALGFGVRCITMYPPWGTWTMAIGQSLIGGGAVVPFSGVSMLSSLWFPLSQRATATSISTLMGFFGLALSFIIGPIVVPEYATGNGSNKSHLMLLAETENSTQIDEQREAIALLMYFEAGIAGAILLLVLIYFPAKPPTPPTLSGHVERLDTMKGLRSLFRNRAFLLVLVSYCSCQGIYGAFCIILDIDVQPVGVSQKTAGWMGFYSTIGGCAACFVVSWLSDRFMRKIKCLLFLLLFPTVGLLVWFCLLVGSYIPYDEASLYVTSISPGVFLFGAAPLFYELACETAYPTGEGVTTMLLTLVNNFIGCVFLGVLSVPNLGIIWMNYLLIASVVFSIVMLLFTRIRYHRTDLDIQEIDVPPPVNVLYPSA